MQQNQLIQTIIIAAAIIVVALIVINTVRSGLKKRRNAYEPDMQMLQYEASGVPRGINVIADEQISIEELMEKDKNNTLGQLQGLVQKDSEMIAQLLRNWLSDDYRR